MMINLKKAPYKLNDEQVKWVENTIKGMTEDEKLEQLFCPLLYSNDPNYLKMMVNQYNFGGLMFRPGPSQELKLAIDTISENAKIPMLLAANLEDGGVGAAFEGTYVGRQMLIGATDKTAHAYELGKVCGSEGRALGLNWSFSPIVDIDMNFTNPITNVRTYGSDKDKVLSMASEYIKGLTEYDVIPTIKHFPGDGVDGRDQHLVTSVNSLSLEDWEASFGKVYRQLIAEGAESIMIGHIAMPAMEEYIDGKPCQKVIPASISKNILSGYLRKEMGFNGLIITDASPMVGLMSSTKRSEAVPMAIENGCDMFLFTKDLEEDIHYMKEGYKKGVLSKERLEEALTRILALKAARLLESKNFNANDVDALALIGCKDHQDIARRVADEGVTLVKDVDGLLPIAPAKHKRVLLQILGDFDSNDRVYTHFEHLLTQEGFQVTRYVPETMETIFTDTKVEDFKAKYDLVFYIGNIENSSNKTVSRLNWHTLFGAGNNIPWFVHEVPTLFVSVGNPYHLYDVPMIGTFINAYCHAPSVIDAVVEKMLGRSSFKGVSPVDPFCGQWDTKL